MLNELLQFKMGVCYSNLAYAALSFYVSAKKEQNISVLELLKISDNGKRLFAAGALADLEHCCRINTFPVVPLYKEGVIKRAGDFYFGIKPENGVIL
ncbi:MAG: 2-phosphosulfolactate phosphatase [Bacillota bacterium]